MPDPSLLPVVVIACRVFQDLLERHLPPELGARVIFKEYGLHRVPARLKEALQETIDGIVQPSLIILGYGLCGNGLDGLQAGPHTLLVARADDCIALLLGSYERYIRLFREEPGTYYLTKGWLESGSDPLKEYREYEEKYGAKKAQMVMDMQYQHYKKLVLVAHTREDLAAYRPRALEVAAYCARWGMEYSEALGSDAFIRGLIEEAQALAEGRNGRGADPDYVAVAPGGALRQADFVR